MASDTEAGPNRPLQSEAAAPGIAPGADWLLLQKLLLEPLQNEIRALRERVEMLEQNRKPSKHRGDCRETDAPSPADPACNAAGEDPASAGSHEGHKTLWGLLEKPASWLRYSNANCNAPSGLLDVLLIHRSTHTLLERQSRARPESLVQPIATMLETLQATLKDDALLTRYAQQRFIRAENITYGIHLGQLAFLITVIAGDHPEAELRRCCKVLAKLHHDEMLTLADFDPSEPYPRLLPPGMVDDQ